jgi:hypothetical protein
MIIVIYADEIARCMQRLREAFHALAELVMGHWGAIKQTIEQFEEPVYLDDRPVWNTPKRVVKKSQVLNRKPLLIRARTYC